MATSSNGGMRTTSAAAAADPLALLMANSASSAFYNPLAAQQIVFPSLEAIAALTESSRKSKRKLDNIVKTEVIDLDGDDDEDNDDSNNELNILTGGRDNMTGVQSGSNNNVDLLTLLAMQPNLMTAASSINNNNQNQDLEPPHKMHHSSQNSSRHTSEAPGGGGPTDLLPNGRKKPGRKQVQEEPSNKRTAQNRAAQRAFRERRVQYVKDLEMRVEALEAERNQLAALIGNTQSTPLVQVPLTVKPTAISAPAPPQQQQQQHHQLTPDENALLKQRIAQLESENNSLKRLSFAFDFNSMVPKVAIPPTVGVNATSPLFPVQLGAGAPKSMSSGTPQSLFADAVSIASSSPLMPGSAKPASPINSANWLTPRSNSTSLNSNILTGNNNNNISNSPTFDDLFDVFDRTSQPASSSRAWDEFGIEPIVPTQSLFPDSVLGSTTPAAGASSDFLTSLLTGSDAVAAAAAAPASSSQPQTNSKQLFSTEAQYLAKPATASEIASASAGVPTSADLMASSAALSCLPCEQDTKVIDDLCDIFKAKAQCIEMRQMQGKIMEACEAGNRDKVLELMEVVREKKRMHMLRLKAGVTVPPQL